MIPAFLRKNASQVSLIPIMVALRMLAKRRLQLIPNITSRPLPSMELVQSISFCDLVWVSNLLQTLARPHSLSNLSRVNFRFLCHRQTTQRDPGLCVQGLCLFMAFQVDPLSHLPTASRRLHTHIHQKTLRQNTACRLDTIFNQRVRNVSFI